MSASLRRCQRAARSTGRPERRPHSALGYLTPVAYAANLSTTRDRLRNPDQLRRSHVAPPAPHGVKPAEALTPLDESTVAGQSQNSERPRRVPARLASTKDPSTIADHERIKRSRAKDSRMTSPSGLQSWEIFPPSWPETVARVRVAPNPSSAGGAGMAGPPRSVHVRT